TFPLSLAHIVRLDMTVEWGGEGEPLVGAIGRGRRSGLRSGTLWQGSFPTDYPGSGALEIGHVQPGDRVDFTIYDIEGVPTGLVGSRTILEHGDTLPPFID